LYTLSPTASAASIKCDLLRKFEFSLQQALAEISVS